MQIILDCFKSSRYIRFLLPSPNAALKKNVTMAKVMAM